MILNLAQRAVVGNVGAVAQADAVVNESREGMVPRLDDAVVEVILNARQDKLRA